MKRIVIASGVLALTVGLHAASTGAVSSGETWAANGETSQMIKGVLNAHCPGCSADDVIAGTSDGGLIGGFLAEGPVDPDTGLPEVRLVFCSDALTASTQTSGSVSQVTVDGKLQYLLWKYRDLSGEPETTGAALQGLVWMMASDAFGRSSVWSADGTAFTPENWDTKDPWATDNRVGFHMVDPQYPIHAISSDGSAATVLLDDQDFGHSHTIAQLDTVTLSGTAGNDGADLGVTFAGDAVDPTYAVTDVTRDGTTATATLGSKTAGDVTHDFEVGDEVTIADTTDFNGTFTLTAVAGDDSTISWADTGAATDENGITASVTVDVVTKIIQFVTNTNAAVAFPADATLTVQGAHDDLVTALDARTRDLYLEGASNATPWALNADETGVTLLSANDTPIEGHTITVSAPGEDPVDLTSDENGAVVWPEAWGDPGFSTTWSASAVAPGTVWEILPSNNKQEMLITGEDGSVSGSWTSDSAPTTTTVAPSTTTTIAPSTTTTIAATTTTAAPTTTTVVVPSTFPATGVSEEGFAMSLQIALFSVVIGVGVGGLAIAARRK